MREIPRLAVLAGVRTPFAKSFGELADTSAVELGTTALRGVLARSGIEPGEIDEVVLGNVCSPADAANVSRVVALQAGIPQQRIAHTVNRNCASGMESILQAWQILESRSARTVIAGGTESMSNVPLMFSRQSARLMMQLGKAKSLTQKLGVLARFRPRHFKPVVGLQLGLTDPVCGLNMGETAEVLATEFDIPRLAQDTFALASHQKAVAAIDRCFMSGEIMPLEQVDRQLDRDVGPRREQSLEALSALRPLFRVGGSVTAGNSCPVTDGAAAVIVSDAPRGDQPPLGYLTGYAIAGCDPRRMGLGPVYATARLLEQTGMTLKDFDLFEINEAFAVQVLACLSAFESKEFAARELGRSQAIGEIPQDRLNVNGGAIALGHPVGTTGTRMIITLLRALRERGLQRGLATLCVGGGQGVAVAVETEV